MSVEQKDMPIQSFDALVQNLRGSAPKNMAVVAAEEEHVLEAVARASADGIVRPILIGDAAEIKRILSGPLAGMAAAVEGDLESTIVHEADPDAAASLAVRMVNEGRADFLMKGRINTANLLKPVVNKESGLRKGGLISLLTLMQIPRYHKLIAMSDGGMAIAPTLEQKKAILENAVATLRDMGCPMPKVGVMCAVENVNPKMPETVDAAALAEMNRSGEISDCIVEGPISMDLALSAQTARLKGYESRIAGEVDVMIWPGIAAGNLVTKALTELAGADAVTLAVGAKVPMVISSRGASADTKYKTIVAAASAL
ncbi:hypothetical protein LJC36_04455 [Desulfovibrio sp. OttesenSCG-928-C14]|nr:hypothetical protein [Desulfovibrio sp. OttesenSCG-928-C14]